MAFMHAWDSKLLNPKARLVLLMALPAAEYPKDSYVDADVDAILSNRNTSYVVGLSDNSRPVRFSCPLARSGEGHD